MLHSPSEPLFDLLEENRMAAQALYRRWRPMTFDEVVGQDHITHTLRNALYSERVSHAYLFAGPRGTGKTTTASLPRPSTASPRTLAFGPTTPAAFARPSTKAASSTSSRSTPPRIPA